MTNEIVVTAQREMPRPHVEAPVDGASIPRCQTAPWIVTWLTWPILFVAGVGGALLSIMLGWNYSTFYPTFLLLTVAVLMALEFAFPLREQWRMTWRSFRRDLKYFAAGSITIAAVNAVFALASIRLTNNNPGPLTEWPLYAGVPAALLAVDFLQYWQHRWSHELGGRLGRFLWRIHVAHHLPDRVYVLMHPAGHPINGLIVRGVATLLPLYYLGASAETVLLVNVVITLQGLVAHCNVDLRAGWFNYVFVGTELHRFHHRADVAESKNYAVALSLLDIAFGTFRYNPGRLPARLGVVDQAAYPGSNEFWKVMRLPFG